MSYFIINVRSFLLLSVVLVLGAACSHKHTTPAARDASAALAWTCPGWGLTSESGPGWQIGSDMCVDVWSAATAGQPVAPAALDAAHGACPSGGSRPATVELSTKPPPFGAAEGRIAHCLEVKDASGGMALRLLNTKDIRTLAGGSLVFELSADTIDGLVVGMQWHDGQRELPLVGRISGVKSNGWSRVSIPLADFGADLAALADPFKITAQIGLHESRVFCVDDVHFETACVSPTEGPRDGAAAARELDASDGMEAPKDGCLAPFVPQACVPAGETAEQQVHGILFECHQDVLIDQEGEAKVGWWISPVDAGAILSPTSARPTSPIEGADMLCVTVNQGSGSAFVYYDSPRDLSAYRDGYLEAELFADADVQVGLSWQPAGSAEQRRSVRASDYAVPSARPGWRSVSIPLCAFGADLTSLKVLGSFGVEGRNSPTTFCVDAIRLRKATSSCRNSCLTTGAEDESVERPDSAISDGSREVAAERPVSTGGTTGSDGTTTGGAGGAGGRDAATATGGTTGVGSGGTGGPTRPPCPQLYADRGIPAGTVLWTWSGADWGLAASTFDGTSSDCNGVPEGTTCFRTQSGPNGTTGNNYAGWGVFAGTNSNWDLSGCTRLIFCARSDGALSTLKVEMQTVSKSGSKYAVYPTLTAGLWQPITITKDQFVGASFASVFGAFLVTVEDGGQTFSIDDVRWDSGSGELPPGTCQSQEPVSGLDAAASDTAP